jgi:hypothetical protein
MAVEYYDEETGELITPDQYDDYDLEEVREIHSRK